MCLLRLAFSTGPRCHFGTRPGDLQDTGLSFLPQGAVPMSSPVLATGRDRLFLRELTLTEGNRLGGRSRPVEAERPEKWPQSKRQMQGWAGRERERRTKDVSPFVPGEITSPSCGVCKTHTWIGVTHKH